MTRAGNDSVLELREVTKVFGSGASRTRVLDQVSLGLAEGEFVTVMGSNGAGKTTLLDLVAGTEPVSAGIILLDGEEVQRWPEHRRARFLARVYQDPTAGLAPRLTVRENLLLRCRRGGRLRLRSAYRARRLETLTEGVAHLGLGLEERLDQRVEILSLGQMQALAVYLATLEKPRILLLDEHVSALDPQTAERVMRLTARRVQESRAATLMVTHSLDMARRYGDRLVVMHQGRLAFEMSREAKQALGRRDLLERLQRHTGGDRPALEVVPGALSSPPNQESC